MRKIRSSEQGEDWGSQRLGGFEFLGILVYLGGTCELRSSLGKLLDWFNNAKVH